MYIRSSHYRPQQRHLLAFLPHSWAAQTFVHSTASKDFVLSCQVRFKQLPRSRMNADAVAKRHLIFFLPTRLSLTTLNINGTAIQMARPVLAIGPHSSKSFWICSSPQNQEINRRSIGKTWDWLHCRDSLWPARELRLSNITRKQSYQWPMWLRYIYEVWQTGHVKTRCKLHLHQVVTQYYTMLSEKQGHWYFFKDNRDALKMLYMDNSQGMVQSANRRCKTEGDSVILHGELWG